MKAAALVPGAVPRLRGLEIRLVAKRRPLEFFMWDRKVDS